MFYIYLVAEYIHFTAILTLILIFEFLLLGYTIGFIRRYCHCGLLLHLWYWHRIKFDIILKCHFV